MIERASPTANDKVLQEIVRRIVEVANPEKVILSPYAATRV